jgi:hypothetical protein
MSSLCSASGSIQEPSGLEVPKTGKNTMCVYIGTGGGGHIYIYIYIYIVLLPFLLGFWDSSKKWFPRLSAKVESLGNSMLPLFQYKNTKQTHK